jgi:hypothetical protein
MSDFEFKCPHCQQPLEAPSEMAGQTIDCPACKGSIQIVDPQSPPRPRLTLRSDQRYTATSPSKVSSQINQFFPTKQSLHPSSGVQTAGLLLVGVSIVMTICGLFSITIALWSLPVSIVGSIIYLHGRCPSASTLVKWGGGFMLGLMIPLLLLKLTGQIPPDKKGTVTAAPASNTASKPKLTTAQHILEAKIALETNYQPNEDPKKASWGMVADAEEHLRAIDRYESDSERNETQVLLKEVERRNLEIKRTVAILTKEMMIKQRREYREKLDKRFLQYGMDVDVVLEGTEEDILKLRYVLWNRPLMYQFTKGGDMSSGSFLSNLEQAGFKKVYFDNKHDFNSCYDLQ